MFGGMIGGALGTLANKIGGLKKKTDDGTTLAKKGAMAGSKAAEKGKAFSRKTRTMRSFSMR